MRTAEIKRDSMETRITVKVNLDGTGNYSVNTPNGFFTHMLELLSKHSAIDMEIDVKGDTQVDLHHTVEDTGIVLGEALSEALGDKKGIERYASVILPMDEVGVEVALDLGGRSNIVYEVQYTPVFDENSFDYSLIKEFMKALSDNLKATLHFYNKNYSTDHNNHHIAEAVFKGLARSLKQAVKISGTDIPSTKGIID